MSLGVHFAIDSKQLKALRKCVGDDEAVLEFTAELEEAWDDAWLAECDKAWDAMHRALSDGELTFDGGLKHAPLGHVVLGGESICEDEDETVVLLTPGQVARASKALQALTEEQFRERYFRLCSGYAPEFGEEDFGYTWGHLEAVRALFIKAAKAKRATLFTVSA